MAQMLSGGSNLVEAMMRGMGAWVKSYGDMNAWNFGLILLFSLPLRLLLAWLHAGRDLSDKGQMMIGAVVLWFCLKNIWRLYEESGIRIAELLMGACGIWTTLMLIHLFFARIGSTGPLDAEAMVPVWRASTAVGLFLAGDVADRLWDGRKAFKVQLLGLRLESGRQ
jgi:hypothetical protein